MELEQRSNDRLIFRFSAEEKQLLLSVVKLYPVVPPSHYELSKTADPDAIQENQELLEKALEEQRGINKRVMKDLLFNPQRFQEDMEGCRLWLQSHEIEPLLQVLNDIRVGSWIRLGSPENLFDAIEEATLETSRYLWAMEVSGAFESSLLMALQSE